MSKVALARHPTYTGLKFVPTPKLNEQKLRRELMEDFNPFERTMRLQYIYMQTKRMKHHILFMSNRLGNHQEHNQLPLKAF